MTSLQWIDVQPVMPEIFMALSAMVLLVTGAFRGNKSTGMICWAAVACLAITGTFLLNLEWDGGLVMNGMFVLDQFTGFTKLVILLGLIAALSLSVKYIKQENMARFEYPVLVLLAGLGMLLMVSANSLLSLYVGLELQSLSLYVLAAIRRDHARAAEAGIKYFVLGALSSGMLLFGASLVYGYTGSLSFDVIASTLAHAPDAAPATGLIIGMVFVIAGIAFKISAAPFHMWTPDVYEGAPTSVTALFAIVPKIAAMAMLMRVMFGPFGPLFGEWQQVIWFLAAASMIVGAFAALVQDNIKRLMAYSSIGNMGYALIGLAAGGEGGASAVLIYMVLYMIMTAGAFAVILSMRRGDIALERISDLAGLSRTHPFMAYTMAILMFSMSGIPPMAGFFGKLFIFNAAVESGLYVLAVLGVLSSVVAAFYYLRIIKVMFFDEPVDAYDKDRDGFARRAVMLVSVFIVLFFIFSPQLLVDTSRLAVSSLFL